MAIPLFRSRPLRPWLSRYFPLTTIAVGITLAIVGLQEAGIFQGLELSVLDLAFRLRPLETKKIPIVIVTISEADFVGLNQFPISDQTLSKVIERLKQENPTVIGLNLYRDLPVEPGYPELLQTFRSTPNLIGVEKFVKDSAGRGVRPPPILRDRDQVAFNDLVGDFDGKIRRSLLSVQKNGETEQALGTQLALAYLKTMGITPQRHSKSEIQLGRTTYSALSRNSGGYAQTDIGGFQVLSNYLRIPGGIPKISIQDVLKGRIPPGLLRDRIVVIGSTSESSRGDRFLVPYTTNVHTIWFGVEIHANLAAQLISGALDGRTTLQCLPESSEWFVILLWASVGTLLGWGIQSLRSLIWIPLSIAVLGIVAYNLFLVGWWMIVISPLIAFLSAGLISRGYWVWYTLKQINQSLELKVLQRTQELQQQNIDLEKAKLAADAANQAKSLFLASVNHELRTPLTSILGFSELLRRSKNLNETEKEDLAVIYRSGNHLLDLVNNVLDLSKVEAGAMSLELEITHLPTLLNTVEQIIQGSVLDKQLTFVTDYDPSLPLFVQLDQRKLRQILINLLSNAVKFTAEGSIRLEVQLEENQLLFQVTDTGSGISSSELPHIFQPFFQTEAGRDSQQGTGLGLAISRQFAEIMGGHLSVQSTIAEGSIFTLNLPFTPCDAPPHLDPIPETTWQLAVDQPRHKILIIDDEVSIGRFLVQLLSQVGFEVRASSHGREGIAQWQAWQPHLILLDLQMPDLDGHTIAQQIRTTEQSYELDSINDLMTTAIDKRDTILIAMTANSEIPLSTIFASGFDDVIWKPFREGTILTKIGQYLEVCYESLK